jgi:hypothetical protein
MALTFQRFGESALELLRTWFADPELAHRISFPTTQRLQQAKARREECQGGAYGLIFGIEFDQFRIDRGKTWSGETYASLGIDDDYRFSIQLK